MSAVLQKFELQTGAHGNVLSVPGILAFGQDQLFPLMPVFERFDVSVTGVNYGGDRFSAEHSIAGLRQLILPLVVNPVDDRRTVLFASSLGGMLVAKLLTELRSQYGIDRINQTISTIINDSPASSEHLVLAPFLPGGINPGVGKLFTHFTPSEKSNESYGKRLLNTFRVPPKDNEIELIEGGPTAAEIKQLAIHGLSGHAFTVWYDQLRWMLNTTLDLTGLTGLDVTYMACIKGNVTVRQPQAVEAWKPFVRRVIEVPTPHCAYLQAQPTWVRTLNPIIEKMFERAR
ncbi:MAG: hypothetical protein ACOH18_04655 [Candidatus Saccharimonadaceae bacterium]